MKLPFNSIFRKEKGRYILITPIRVCGIEVNSGVSFTENSDFIVGGLNWRYFVGKDIEVRSDGKVAVIKGIY